MECAPHHGDGHSVLLVVDDYPENLLSMRALLQREDWHVVTAASGVEALEKLLKHEVDLVLLDVKMPGMDGFEVARLMRGSQRTRMTPIIFLTANAQSPAAVLEGYASGAIDYLFKPFDPHILKPKVQALLEHQRNRRALQRLTHELESARAFNASVLDNAAEGILVVGEGSVIEYANPAISRLLNATMAELRGESFLSFLQKPHVPAWLGFEMYLAYRQGQTWRLHDAILRTSRGQQVPVALSCAPLPAEQKAMVVTVLDMSEVRHLHQQLEFQAVTDPLTGLLNRRGFYQAAENILLRSERNEQSLVLLYLDLDGFKRVNDSLGHDAGDRVLRWVSEQLQGCLRSYDILGRMGGDEFTALLELEFPEQAAKIAEKLIERVSICQQVDGLDVMLGVSIGIATFPDCGSDVNGLLRAADIAMYEAKRAGRQQYRYYDQEMNGRARSRLMLEDGVRTAIQNKEFTLVYQPQVALADGRVRGVEALLRWQHPSVGDVPPGLFLPLLEEARLISQLSTWIYQQVGGQLQAWHAGLDDELVLSVSLSSSQFNMPNLASQLQQVLERHGLQGRQLEVEISEDCLMSNLEESIKQLKLLRQIGVRTALDDFGLGNCSLAHLRDLAFDTLKLDPQLVARLPGSARDEVMARSIIELCGHFDVVVVAEGVETQEQAQWLKANGCPFIQGPMAAQPLVAEEVAHWCHARLR
ncbi:MULTISPECIES: bifunctional diguanylate cyclase/phosphodiesterase [unclassified Pseudomonas]|jgi:diguanylate cyclase (GGDEF)-like protein/PAS domain S-box-containing protein|uniref:putative bifunctional diguanylate cyclase/phosphodiesterase n=1 Tax=unclassified Pseudomonas TaxID=196821 RepID=UPI0008C0780C|nr:MULTISPECIES: EAL domain-containing protein [unclassified Pseudomonas]SET09585.1 PAS domain S-box-containing protein/diguanylate cyclase (GGDEF) domain-containing protein [Pseudomonas sp. NFR09]SFA76113.1 PAS domain S-box-containing protein/diguanylate cyclase (GGDEF) domain-containing protein [Pseudomonas sp. NFPP24]SFH97669.1 PAS domain S-box-containing protein/diguanylate cyclase (GGDEF) domain-containing protein [Pseudomonas sp. NFPP04]SFJ01129.1 PAS domain S-box-containing protein/digua